MNKQDFDGLYANIRQAGAIRRGEVKPSRVTEFPSADVKTIRQQLGTSHSRPSESKEME
jgi:putative transcriptional regulator